MLEWPWACAKVVRYTRCTHGEAYEPMSVGSMGRKRPSKGSGKPLPPETTKAFRMSGAYAEWIERFANSERVSVASLLDRALAEHAKVLGFEVPPDRIP